MKTHTQAGIALLVVMMLGAIIIPFAAEFAYQISIESITASNVTRTATVLDLP